MRSRTPIRIVLLGLLILFTGSACSLPPFSSSPDAPPSLPSRVFVELFPPEHAIQGEPADYTFEITNQTNHPIILLELIPKSRDVAGGETGARTINSVQNGTKHRWTHLLGGSLSRHTEKEQFAYSPSSNHLPTTSNEHVYSGLLFPDQTTQVDLRLLHLEHGRFTQHFTLRYHRTTRQQLLNRMYVPNTSLTNRQTQTVTFRRGTPPLSSNVSNSSFFLVHPSYQIVVEQTFSRDIRVYESSFPPSEAEDRLRKQIGMDQSLEQFRFDPWTNRWIIRTEGNQVWGVSLESIERLPEGSFSDYRYLATAEGPVTFYPGPTIPSNSERIAPLRTLAEKEGTRKRQTDVKNALDLLQVLRNAGMNIQWTREPITNQPAVIVQPPGN